MNNIFENRAPIGWVRAAQPSLRSRFELKGQKGMSKGDIWGKGSIGRRHSWEKGPVVGGSQPGAEGMHCRTGHWK